MFRYQLTLFLFGLFISVLLSSRLLPYLLSEDSEGAYNVF